MQNLSLSIFDAIVASPNNGEVLSMNSLEISELTGSRHDSVKRTVERLADSGAIVQPPMVDEQSTDSMGRPRSTEVYIFSGPQGRLDSITVVAQLDPAFTAALVKRWDALETGKAKPAMVQQAAQTMHADPAARALVLAGIVSDVMNLQGSARLGVVHNAMQLTAPQFLPMLPSYAVDAPAGAAAASSSETTHSLTYLLKRHGIEGTAAQWNAAFEKAGILERMTRPSRSKGTVSYWSITKNGLKYGKNVTNPKNQLETQPHWYDSKFPELICK